MSYSVDNRDALLCDETDQEFTQENDTKCNYPEMANTLVAIFAIHMLRHAGSHYRNSRFHTLLIGTLICLTFVQVIRGQSVGCDINCLNDSFLGLPQPFHTYA